ncbi:Response regulator receiver domain-containing protein [Poseidonocella pacifica]|uniref:Response regulator receiver domain-containing protein n=1 Tax=Poseidonocella pacifica TaxID=871651 RepID=A0A1I0YND0_9RHOB|nr:response regulator [Poseidonocella pacifica]SFB14417.1 Response regulator receiver domain-containing protein [Poseidonocella pacifica]
MKALIVEDDPHLSFTWKETLEDTGFECFCVSSTKEATACALRARYDLYVLDLFVEDGNTVSLSDWIAIRHPGASILMVTGSGMFAQGDHTQVASGVSWLLRKPINVSDLAAVAEYLAGRSGREVSQHPA